MSTAPWGTMNGWLRFENEQRGRWMQQRVQDLRAAQVAGLPAVAAVRPADPEAPRPATTSVPCADAA